MYVQHYHGVYASIYLYILPLHVPSRSTYDFSGKSENEALPSIINQGTFIFLS